MWDQVDCAQAERTGNIMQYQAELGCFHYVQPRGKGYLLSTGSVCVRVLEKTHKKPPCKCAISKSVYYSIILGLSFPQKGKMSMTQ